MPRPTRLVIAVTALSLLLASCGDSGLPPLPSSPATTLGTAAGRPASVRAPSDYDPSVQYPLVVLLHGFMAAGLTENIYLGLSNLVTTLGFVLVIPDGTPNMSGQRFWNATDACCDFDDQGVDDVGYITDLIAEAQANYRIDPRRVYLVGHSNGGFMSYRMACDAPESIAAIASLAGATYLDPARCESDLPVSVLQIHGTADDVVLYEGASGAMGLFPTGYPSATETARRSAERAGCDVDAAVSGEDLDLETQLAGSETHVLEYQAGCDRGVDVALWSMEGGGHIPVIDRTAFSTAMLEWLFRHRR